MLTIIRKLSNTLAYPINKPYKLKEIMFFDIETTGLSANTSFVYLIGCITYEENSWQLTQWLLEDPNQEIELLKAFSHKAKSLKRIIHYNGNNFDTPYLTNKYIKYNLQLPFSDLDSLDLYKKVMPYKKLFAFPNLKLKTIEKYLGFNRKDQYSGKELINIYQQYIGMIKYELLISKYNIFTKVTMSNPSLSDTEPSNNMSSDELANILLLHNSEDIVSLLKVSNILSYTDFFEYKTIEEDIINIDTSINDNLFLIHIKLAYSFPYEAEWSTPLEGKNEYTIKLKANDVFIKVPLINGRLKYFFENYRDYYYLPKEDMAIHKSVAMYVDREYKTKAKPANSYTYMEGRFIPAPNPQIFKNIEINTFKKDYKSSLNYIELSKLDETDETLNLWLSSLMDFTKTSKETNLLKEIFK